MSLSSDHLAGATPLSAVPAAVTEVGPGSRVPLSCAAIANGPAPDPSVPAVDGETTPPTDLGGVKQIAVPGSNPASNLSSRIAGLIVPLPTGSTLEPRPRLYLRRSIHGKCGREADGDQDHEAWDVPGPELSPLVLVPHRLISCDVVHYHDAQTGNTVRSTANRFHVRWGGREYRFAPALSAWKRVFGPIRMARRMLRSDKANAVPNHRGDGLVILYNGVIWFFDFAKDELRPTGKLRNCRNALHGGIAVTEHGIYFGEYGANPRRGPVPIWGSRDDGRSWEVIHCFDAGSIKHVHGIYSDPYTGRLWLTTGDFNGECILVSADTNFTDIQAFGDGSQRWRPVSLFFTRDHLIWAMDSPLETCRLQVFDRQTGQLSAHREFPGPVWYTKLLTDGIALLQTTVEIGAGVQSSYSRIFASENLFDWYPVARFRKDPWPMPLFKFGVIAFADGPQNSGEFVFFGEALQGLDGTAMEASLVRTR